MNINAPEKDYSCNTCIHNAKCKPNVFGICSEYERCEIKSKEGEKK